MSIRSTPRIRYRSNRKPMKRSLGRKVQDEQNGAWTYKDRLVVDDFGTMVDPRFGTWDVDDSRDTERGGV